MPAHARLLITLYLVTGLLALALTWAHVFGYFDAGLLGGNLAFWNDALAGGTAAHRFLLVDLFFLVFAIVVWMVAESRRVGLRWVWAYVAAGILIGISLAVPLFLAAREAELARRDAPAAVPAIGDWIGLGLLGAVTLAVGVYLL